MYLNVCNIRIIFRVTLSLGLLLYTLFQCIHKVIKFSLNFSMKCSNLTFNAQGLRVIIVVVQVGASGPYTLDLHLKSPLVYHKMDDFLSFIPPFSPPGSGGYEKILIPFTRFRF